MLQIGRLSLSLSSLIGGVPYPVEEALLVERLLNEIERAKFDGRYPISTLPCAVIRMMGMGFDSVAIFSTRPMPDRPGISTSATTQSKDC